MADRVAKVLIVESEPFYRDAASEILAAAGFGCADCEDCDTALGLAQEPSIAVVLVDLALPRNRQPLGDSAGAAGSDGPRGLQAAGAGGLELVGRLSRARPDLRVITLSAGRDREAVLDAFRAGACDHVSKPLHDEELVLAVGRAMESHRAVSARSRLLDRLAVLATSVAERMQRPPYTDAHRAAAPDLPVERLARAAAEVASEVLGARRTSLMLLDEAGQELQVIAGVGGSIAPRQMDSRRVGEGVAGFAFRCSGGLVVDDIAADDRFATADSAAGYQTPSFAVVPIDVAERAIGVLCAADLADGGSFAQEDLALLRLIALHVAELLPEATGPAPGVGEAAGTGEPPVEAERRFDALDAELVREICDAVVAEVEPERVVRAALLPLARSLEAAPVSIYLTDPDTGELRLEGENDGGLRCDRGALSPTRGLTGTVFQTGQLVASAAPEVDPRFDPASDTAEDGVPGPFLCVPLQLRGKTIGLFRAFPREGIRASARTGEMLSAALSAAVRSVLLYRSLLATIEEVALARRQAR